jgi:uncharacterized membrane protein YdjX (TVP38/TMEM64 family)
MTNNQDLETNQNSRKASLTKPLIFLVLLVVIVIAVRVFHLQDYVEEERLRQTIAAYGIWGPLAYILVWLLAPPLFLPGLPITLAGGILFGPFWGVVYTAFGATGGASLAFLVARYLARDWVASKLTGAKLRTLDEKVAQHGWKIVAFTRLVPVFPYFLLNYAFGITRVSFAAFFLATFFGMMPATIAFVYFSSHILDVLKGKISSGFIIGLILVVLVSLIPVAYKKLRGNRREPLE